MAVAKCQHSERASGDAECAACINGNIVEFARIQANCPVTRNLANSVTDQLNVIMQAGGLILCGGQSSRMGLPKVTLPFGDELMLQRVYRLLSKVAQPTVVVTAAEQ